MKTSKIIKLSAILFLLVLISSSSYVGFAGFLGDANLSPNSIKSTMNSHIEDSNVSPSFSYKSINYTVGKFTKDKTVSYAAKSSDKSIIQKSNNSLTFSPTTHSALTSYSPIHNNGIEVPDTWSSLFGYSSEPAPMGIVDYGLGPPVDGLYYDTYSYSTPIFAGNVTINSLLALGNQSTGSWVSFQLNAVLVFTNSGTQYSYWIQDVAELNTQNDYLYFQDNIWNLSSISAGMLPSTIQGNGGIYPSSAGDYYGAVAGSLPGN